MPGATVRGIHLNYEVVGDGGPWVALSPGARWPLERSRPLARRIADAGHRVLVHDRRNCGASDVSIDGSASEFEHWADDLHELLGHLDAHPAWVGGTSSGCRLSLLLAIRHPETVRGLLLWRVTGGAFAARMLAQQYYEPYLDAVQRGGMAAVCATEHFSERIRDRPTNRDLLLAMDPGHVAEVLTRWRDALLAEADLPVIGATEAELRAIAVPTMVVPGNDNRHAPVYGDNVHRLVAGSERHVLFDEHVDVDMVPPEQWHAKEPELAALFLDFMRRHTPGDA